MSRNGSNLLRGPIRECLAVLAFLAFFAHALIPVGFMPGTVHGQPQLVICDSDLPGLAHHHHHGQHGNSGSHSNVLCAFAMSGGAAPLPADLDYALAQAVPELPVSFIERPVVSETPPRYTAPRGPPTFA